MELGTETKHHGLSHKDRVRRRSLEREGGGGVAARRVSATGIGGGGEVTSSRPRGKYRVLPLADNVLTLEKLTFESRWSTKKLAGPAYWRAVGGSEAHLRGDERLSS